MFKGKNVIVTGGSKGLGFEICKQFLEEGANVSFCSRNALELLKTNDNLINNENDTTIDSTNFFIGYLYLYYIMFDSLSLYKPTSSNSNNREFYVIGKKFKGINSKELKNLYTILDYYVFNSAIIEKEKIPITFVYQIDNFLKYISKYYVI